MNSNKEYNYTINKNNKKNINSNIMNNDNNIYKNSLFTDSENEEFFKRNYGTENIINKNKDEYTVISNLTKPKSNDININSLDKINYKNYTHFNYNNYDNTIPIGNKYQKPEIQSIDKILKCLKIDNNDSLKKNIKYNNNYDNVLYKNELNNMPSLEKLKYQKDILIYKLKKIKQKNKELMAYLEPYNKHVMTNEDIENEQRIKYIKFLDDKRKEYIAINNKLRHKLINNQNINIKKKIEYLIKKQIKEYEKIYNDDLSTNENYNDIKPKNIYTNNNIEMKCELSLSGANSNSDYKMNNATTDGLINTKHKNILNENNKNINVNVNTNIKKNKLNKNNSNIFEGEDKNKNNDSLKFKKNNTKSNFLSSIKYIKNSKITRNSNTSSSIISSHDNINKNKNNNINKKNDSKLLKQNSKITNGLNYGIK